LVDAEGEVEREGEGSGYNKDWSSVGWKLVWNCLI